MKSYEEMMSELEKFTNSEKKESTHKIDNSFPSLESLDKDNTATKLPKLSELDSKNKEPEETPVTPDGRTLEEMLVSIRSGATKLDDKLREFKNGEKKTTINNKEKADNRYTKHEKRITEEKRMNEFKKSASKKFIQANSRYTEEEKIIMRSLGLGYNDLVKLVSKESKLTQADKNKLINAGKVGMERYFKGKRFRATVGDLDIIQFLAKFKFCNVKILSRLRGEPTSRTWRKLKRLKEGGLVADSEVGAAGTIWYLTGVGMSMSGYNFPPFKSKRPNVSSMNPIIGANHVAACLWNNMHNILMLDDFPKENKLVEIDGVPSYVRGEKLISEQEIRSSLGREAQPNFQNERLTGNRYSIVGEQAKLIWDEWKASGSHPDSPEQEIGNEFLWVLYPDSELTRSYHVPDLVVSRDRAEDGSPRSIAVEVELNPKSQERYIQILMAYKLDEVLYDKVIWLTHSTSIVRRLTMVAEEIGLRNFDVVPLTNENGIYKSRDIWHI